MLGISYFRLGAYAVLAIVLCYLIYQYRTGQEAKKQVVEIKHNLSIETALYVGELDCVVTSKCAAKALQEAHDMTQAVNDEKTKVNAENEAQRQQSEEEQKQSAEHTNAVVNGLRQTIEEKNKRLADQFTHNPACEVVMKMVIPCTDIQ